MFTIPDPPQLPEIEPLPITSETANFCPVSLTDWINLCQRTGVPHIPAEYVTTINRTDWLMFDTPGEHEDRLQRARSDVAQARKPNHMLRYDFCAPLEVKARLSSGNPGFHPDMAELIFDDPRAYDILFEFPREAVPVYQRPWIQAFMDNAFPVEYRVFVQDGHIRGISNYYPQRPLAHDASHINQLTEMTNLLATNLTPPFLWNHSPLGIRFLDNPAQRNGVHFTADYLMTRQGELLFIEGGPPHELGAHPCCFPPGRIDGLALGGVVKVGV